MAYNPDSKGYGPQSPQPTSPAPEYHGTPPVQMGPVQHTHSPPPMGTGYPMQSPPMVYQGVQSPNYQQQPGLNHQDSNPQSVHQAQQVYGQPPPMPYQGGPITPQSMGGSLMPNDSQYKTATPIPNLGMGPAPVDCPSCGKRGMTRISYHAGNTTHIWALITFCFTLCLCFIPYMINSLKDVQHNCGNCGLMLATWHKSGAVDVHIHA